MLLEAFIIDAHTATRGRVVRLACLLISLSGLFSPVCIADHSPNPGLDIVLLMDSSGSMKKTDPHELRKPAAKLFLSLLGPNDHASVISFSDQGYPISYLQGVSNDSEKAQLFSAVEKISSKGVYTNLYDAIETAKQVLERDGDPKQRKIMILMSDGKMDLGDDERSRQYTKKLFSTLLPKLKAANIEVQTIAFTEQSDKTLLANIALETDGMFYVTKSNKELHQTFAAIFEQSSQPDMLPFDEGHFQVDESISEMTIVGSKEEADVTLSLTTPLNTTYFADDRPPQYKWRQYPLFDLITIPNPTPGTWHLQASNNNNKAYVITDLALDASITPAKPFVGDKITLQTWLERDSKVLIKEAILSTLQLTLQVTMPDESTHTFPLSTASTNGSQTNGVFTQNLQLTDSGRYSMILTADSGTFQRSRTLIIEVTDKPAESKQSTEEPQNSVNTDEYSNAPQPDSLSETKEDFDLPRIISIFLGINAFLAAALGITLFLRRRNKQKQ